MTETLAKSRQTEKIRLTAGQAIVRYLSQQKSEQFDGTFQPLLGGVFGIFGHGNVAGVGEALFRYRDEVPFYRGQNEQGMAHAAIAYAKSLRARRIMAVTTSIGPGATNLITAAATAHINRLPVLFLPGDIYSSRRPDPVLQQLEDERSPLCSVNDCFIPVSRYFDRIARPEQLLQSLPAAVEALLNPACRGPATLSLHQDTQAESWLFPESFFEEKKHYIARPRADLRELERAARVLSKAKTPLIIAGGGVLYSAAEETLRLFAERHGIPVAETQAGKGALHWNHPLNLGSIGVLGTTTANSYAKNADAILCIGTRLSDFTTASKSLFHKNETLLICLNTSRFDTLKGNSIPLVADAKAGLDELTQLMENVCAAIPVQPLKKEWEKISAEATAPGGKITDAQVVGAVNRTAGENGIVVCAAGGLPGELQKLWKTSRPLGFHLEYGYSCMGYEIAGGLGVKMARPDKEVYVMVGDGSYLMLHTEILTSLQLGLKLNIILLDNGGFGCINRLQKSLGSAPFGNLFSEQSVDFTANAESYGCAAVKVDTLEALEKALLKQKQDNKTSVIVINTDPHAGTPGSAWWDVAIAEISDRKEVIEANRAYKEKLEELL